MNTVREGATLRATAARIVDAVTTHGRSLDQALAEHEDDVDAQDRALLRLLCYGTLRQYWRLQSYIAELLNAPLTPRDSVVNALIAVGLYQLSETRIPDHAGVSETVEATRLLCRPKLKSLVNAVLRRFLRERSADRFPVNARSNEEVEHNHPQWLIDRFRTDWPSDWRDLLAVNNRPAPMWLRVNPAFGSAADYCERLRNDGIDADRLEGVPQAVRLAAPLSVDALPGFGEGQVSVQDAAAQLAAPWLLARGTGRLLDACAAPGGKSGQLLELGGDAIALECIDNNQRRLEAVRSNLDRLGFDATLLQADASNPRDWWDGEVYDSILLDAPCSASGVIRRHPDIKLLRRPGDIAALARTQGAMLEALWPMLRPGGHLLYVTCSVIAAENDAVVGRFLDSRDDAREDHMLHNNNIRDLMQTKACGFQILPGTAGLDGFYFACLAKDS